AVGTLNRRDANRVERALADDRELARQYELVREELGETIHLNETLGTPSPRAIERLFAAIAAGEGRAPGARAERRWCTQRVLQRRAGRADPSSPARRTKAPMC